MGWKYEVSIWVGGRSPRDQWHYEHVYEGNSLFKALLYLLKNRANGARRLTIR